MSRLLLVDDNPSIHRIAESLLAPTDVELVCVDSAAEALDRIARGERFDVALVDTAMPGMDGWTLLTRLRAMEETARMPIALMAGVLDPVDPAKLAKAPIQGFLKKPIELRELGDRVKTLLATPVPVGISPFSTVPATPAKDLVKRAEAALPEYRREPDEVPPAAASGALTHTDLELPLQEEDLLVLTAEDLWPEESAQSIVEAAPAFPALPDVHLELEELDLDSLQELTSDPLPELPSVAAVAPEGAPTLASVPTLPEEGEHLVTLPGLVELETVPTDFQFPPYSPSVPEPADMGWAAPEPVAPVVAASDPASVSHLPTAASLFGLAGAASVAGLAIHAATHQEPPQLEPPHQEAAQVEPEPLLLAYQKPAVPPLEPPEPVTEPAAGGQEPAVSGQPVPVPADPTSVTAEQARAVVQALLADPVLVDALVKAVVARMGDQVLREIAWEVMPDLAGRLQQ